MTTYAKRASMEGVEKELFQLVSRGASPEQWAEWLRVPLEHAAAQGNLGLVDKLIGAGANGSAGWKGCGGRTLLHAAAVGGNGGVVSSLLAAGCQPDVNVLLPAPPSVSALWLAAKHGHEAVAQFLVVVGADLNFKHPLSSFSALHAAIVGGHERLSEELIMSGADVMARTSDGSTPLHLAVEKGFVPILQTLVRRGADVNSRRPNGCSALHAAAFYDQAGAVDALIEAGADIELKSNVGRTPLCCAAVIGKAKSLLALLRQGASVGPQDNYEQTPIYLACCFQLEGLEVVVDLLLRWGADETAVNEDGDTPVHALGTVHATRTCSQDEVDRVRLLLGRAPADRAWRRRGWLVMLRARASRATDGSHDGSGCAGLEGSNAADGGTGEGRKVARRESATGVADGEQGRASLGVDGVGADGGGGGTDVLRGAVAWLVEMEPAGVFRAILGFL